MAMIFRCTTGWFMLRKCDVIWNMVTTQLNNVNVPAILMIVKSCCSSTLAVISVVELAIEDLRSSI